MKTAAAKTKSATTTGTSNTPPAKAPQPTAAPRAPKAPDARMFIVTTKEFKPSAGLASALYAALKANGGVTAQQAADALLASGAYQKVAPQAAKLRPVRPVTTLLNCWLDQGIVGAVEGQ